MLALTALLLLTAPTAEAKGKPGRKSKKTEAAAVKADTTKKGEERVRTTAERRRDRQGHVRRAPQGNRLPVRDTRLADGPRNTDRQQDLGRPYALNDAGVNKGMGYGEKIVRFRKDTLYKKVWVMTYDPRITSPEGDRITRSVKDNYRETAIEQFPIEAYGKVRRRWSSRSTRSSTAAKRVSTTFSAPSGCPDPPRKIFRRSNPSSRSPKISSSNRSSRPRTPRRARRCP